MQQDFSIENAFYRNVELLSWQHMKVEKVTILAKVFELKYFYVVRLHRYHLIGDALHGNLSVKYLEINGRFLKRIG